LVYGIFPNVETVCAAMVEEVSRDKSKHGMLSFDEMHETPPVARRLAKA